MNSPYSIIASLSTKEPVGALQVGPAQELRSFTTRLKERITSVATSRTGSRRVAQPPHGHGGTRRHDLRRRCPAGPCALVEGTTHSLACKRQSNRWQSSLRVPAAD